MNIRFLRFDSYTAFIRGNKAAENKYRKDKTKNDKRNK